MPTLTFSESVRVTAPALATGLETEPSRSATRPIRTASPSSLRSHRLSTSIRRRRRSSCRVGRVVEERQCVVQTRLGQGESALAGGVPFRAALGRADRDHDRGHGNGEDEHHPRAPSAGPGLRSQRNAPAHHRAFRACCRRMPATEPGIGLIGVTLSTYPRSRDAGTHGRGRPSSCATRGVRALRGVGPEAARRPSSGPRPSRRRARVVLGWESTHTLAPCGGSESFSRW